MTYDHVDCQVTREVLSYDRLDDFSISYALQFANQCCQADQHNEDVSFEVAQCRVDAVDDALTYWSEHKNKDATVAALQRFWSV